MKVLKSLLVIVALVAATQAVRAGDSESGWFDMANCDFCTSMASQPGLMEAMQWETYEISNGSISVVRVDASHLDGFQKACTGMEATQKLAMSGEEIDTCGMCSAMGQAIMAGAKMETVPTPNGHINIMTSDNADVVGQLHAIVEQNNAEMKKMMEHGDHSHGG